MNDLINRQDAIDALKGLPTWWADSGGYYGGAQPPMEALLDPEDAVSAIENLPSAERTGKWKHPYHYGLALPEHQCSECGYWEYEDTESDECPNCGTRMVSEDDT